MPCVTGGACFLQKGMALPPEDHAMQTQRIFPSADYLQPAAGEPVRSVVTETPEAVKIGRAHV